MEDQDRLRIKVTKSELERIRQVAEAKGLDVEEWAREELLKILHERDQES